MHQKDAFMFGSRICRFHFETDKVLGTDFVLCNMNDVTIPHELCIEKEHCVLRHQSQRGVTRAPFKIVAARGAFKIFAASIDAKS